VVRSGTNCPATGGTVLFVFSGKKRDVGARLLQIIRRHIYSNMIM
jgi:hypothetical protein